MLSFLRCAGNAKLWVRAPFRPEKLTPAAKLDRLRIAVRPAEAALSPLTGARDALPDGRTAHALVLTYKFSLAEDGKITPLLPMLNWCGQDMKLFGHIACNTSRKGP